MQYPSRFPVQLDTFVNHGSRDGIGLDIDWQKSDKPSSNEFDLITDAILQIERSLGGGIGVGAGLWDTDRDTGIQVEEAADDDIIRFDTNGVERSTISPTGIFSFQEYLAHLGDADTYLRFTPDRLRVLVGNADILDITEIVGQDTVVWNEGGVDIDFRWEAVGVANALFIQGSDGAVTLGGPLLTLTGGQIKFPAGQVASADANTLDDYERGTFDPVFVSTNNTFTYGTQWGSYVKIGRTVWCNFVITSDTATINTAGSIVKIGGLPYNIVNHVNARGGGAIGAALTFAGDVPCGIQIIEGQPTVQLTYRATANGDFSSLIGSDMKLTAGNSIYGSFWYRSE